jgi:hypothetical protein
MTPLPLLDEPFDVASLGVAEVEQVEEAPSLRRVVVRDRRLEALALRGRLAKLPAQPTEEAHRGLLGHRSD